MSFTANLKTALAVLLALGGSYAMAKSTSGKVVDKLGDAELQKAAKPGDWGVISVGNKIREKDQIRTKNESRVAIVLPDGSSITVQENSLVEFTTIDAENGVQTALTDVKTGKVKFDAQKQHGNGSFKFKTATATAAIRGTDGYFGKTLKDVATYLSLQRGNAIMTNETGEECEAKGGQTVVVRGGKKGCQVFDAQSSGNEQFAAALDSLLDNDKLTDEQLKKAIQTADSTIQDMMNKALDRIKCEFEPIADTVSTNSVSIKGTCTEGVKLSIAGTSVENPQSAFEIKADWAPSSEGIKKFNATCTMGFEFPCEKPKKGAKKPPKMCKKDIVADCGTLTTYYKPVSADTLAADSTSADSTKIDSVAAKAFSIKTSSPVKVCEPGSVTIEGTFDQTDPEGQLYVKLGAYISRNLVPLSANGEFSHTITINDIVGNWIDKKATVEYKGKNGSHRAEIVLDIDKTCRQVNQIRPTITFTSTDSIRCLATFSLTGATDDLVHVSREIDGATAKETAYNQNANFTIKLTPGIHDYAIKAEDQAGNKTTLKKELGCYPPSTPRIDFTNGPTEELRPPPPPPQAAATGIHKTMRFKINGVTQMDPIHVRHIKVTQGNNTLLDISNGQISDLDQNVQVELSRSMTSKIKVFVEMKNGKKITAIKTYKVN